MKALKYVRALMPALALSLCVTGMALATDISITPANVVPDDGYQYQDVVAGESITAGPVQVPAKAANAVIQLGTDLTGGDGGTLAVIRGGVLVEVHFYGRDTDLYASVFAQAEGLSLYEPTLDPSLDGQLPADASFVADLLELQAGDTITDAELTAALDVLPATLAPPGEPLQLAVAVEGGWQVHTLTLMTQYGLPAWTLGESVFADALTPDVWELALMEEWR